MKGLINHDKGRTLKTILNTLREDLSYFVPDPEIVNAKDFGVPQNRERLYIVGFHKDTGGNSFNYPKPTNQSVRFIKVFLHLRKYSLNISFLPGAKVAL